MLALAFPCPLSLAHALRAAGSLGVGVGASAALAATSAIIDSTGQKLRGDQGAFDDGATPPRTYCPYAAQAALKAKAQ